MMAYMSVDRSQRLCLGAFGLWMETYPRSSSHQPSRYICPLVTFGKEICSWIRGSRHCSLLLRGRERLVGIKAFEEANTEHHNICGVAERPESSVWGERLPFNTVCGEYLNNSAGWVHGCAFSPSGNALAFTAHDSSVTVVYPSGPDQPPNAVVSISTQLLPFLSLVWNGEGEITVAGYVLNPCQIIFVTLMRLPGL